ncbi:hypothetical protein AAC03nite_39350 [Alicyclobacillus acidoterrestris]|nr:hypothetical protein AAC03nite_39350 [Alicyclobacillus acidoterrestris]
MATQSDILTALLAAIPDTYDKSVGSFVWDNLAAVAENIAALDDNLDAATDKLSIANLTGDELTQRVYERTGIRRDEATYATGTVTLIGTGAVNAGDLVETQGGIQFQITTTTDITTSGDVPIQAVVAGAAGNVPAGTITLFPVTLSGFTAVTNANPTKGGADEESDSDLLQRYYDYVQNPPTSGNKSEYFNWAIGFQGVGGANVLPLWNGNNTVKVVVVGADKQPASDDIVSALQTYLDPGVTGLGDGVAPIGAFVTTVSATGLAIDFAATLVLSPGYDIATATQNVQASLISYLQTVASEQYGTPTAKTAIVSYAKAGDAILNSAGVEDYSNLTLNGAMSNITVAIEQVAVLGTTNFTT